MPAVVYGKAFVAGADKRLIDVVTAIEAAGHPLVDTYITSVHDVYSWCRRNLVEPTLNDMLHQIDLVYGSWYAGATVSPP